MTNCRTTLIYNIDSSCDTWIEEQNEFFIYQYVDDEAIRVWEWYPGGIEITNQEVAFLLEDSQISRELTVDDSTVYVHLDIIEKDFLRHDQLFIGQTLSALDDSKIVEGFATGQYANEVPCQLKYRYAREVELIVPLPSAGQEIVMKG